MKLENVHLFVSLSGKTKQPSLLQNYWDLVSIYWNVIDACESTCFENKMAACFNDLEDEESFVKKDEQENFPCNIFSALNDNLKERQCSKVNLVINWERWKKNLKAWLYILELAALTNKLRIWDKKVTNAVAPL